MTPTEQSHIILRERAGFCPLGSRTLIELVGADRASVLHGLCTNDINRLQPGDGCEAFLTSVQGKTIGYVYVFCLADSLLLDTAAGLAEETIAGIDRYVIREDVKLVDRSPQWSDVLLSGNQAAARLTGSFDADLPAQPLSGVAGQLEGIEVEVRRVAFAAADCFFMRCDSDRVAELCAALTAAGVDECDREAVETARIEMGTPIFGQDVTGDNLPQEVDRNDRAISFTKGCYLGQETVARIDAMGHVNQKLRGLRLAGDTVPPGGSQIEVDGKAVARITSSCHSPRLSAPLALAYVRRGHDEIGHRFNTQFGEAEVVALPF